MSPQAQGLMRGAYDRERFIGLIALIFSHSFVVDARNGSFSYRRLRLQTTSPCHSKNQNNTSSMFSFSIVETRSHRRRSLSALMLVASAAMLMLSSAPGSSSNHLRFSRFLRIQSKISEKASPITVEAVNTLTDSLLADIGNLYAFDETDHRPVVNTFFAIPEGQSIREEDAAILAVWRQAWSSAGWNPRILGSQHAEAHPDYEAISATLNEKVPLGINPFYDRSCYLRHFAMAASGGGWMTDYDTVPLNMPADVYGKSLPNYGRFTTFENHVPCLIVGDNDEWERVARALLREGIEANASTAEGGLFSDMHALKSLIDKAEVISFQPHSVLQMAELMELIGDDIYGQQTEETSCDQVRHVLAVHFSHASVEHYKSLGQRAVIIAEILARWSKLCDAPEFGFGNPDADDDVVSARINASGNISDGEDGDISLNNDLKPTTPQPGADIWVINQPKSGTGFLVSTVAEAKQCQEEGQEVIDQVRSYEYKQDGTRLFRTHSTTQASKLRLYEYGDGQMGEKPKCVVVSGVRNPHLSIPSRFFESNKDRFCNGEQTKDEIIDEYDAWLRSDPGPRLQMSTTNEVTKAFGIQDFSYALDAMSNSGYALFEGPSDPASPWNECWLLLVQLDFDETSTNIAAGLSLVLNNDVTPAAYLNRSDLCPAATDNYTALKEHSLTEEVLSALAQDNPELRQGFDYYRPNSQEAAGGAEDEPVVDLLAA